MSVEELEEYRAEQRKIMTKAKEEFRKAGKILEQRLSKSEVDALKAKRDAIDAQIAEREGSDG
jgi:hypothetical protein